MTAPLFGLSINRWAYVRRRFEVFLGNLKITHAQQEDGETKHKGVVACLNRAYRGTSNETQNRLLIGSWGKLTRVRPPRDIDVMYILPNAVFWRFQDRSGNRQSQLLQEVKGWLQATYPQTDLRGDGQVVVVPFNTYTVEVAPAFHREGGGYIVCDANDGGRYKHVDPEAELAKLDAADKANGANVRKLTRILKQWQRECNAPIKSFHIEAIVMDILPRLTYGGNDEFWFDWLVRDVFAHMIRNADHTFTMPATDEIIPLGHEWLSRAQSAYDRAVRACHFEDASQNQQAGEEWQKIFGSEIPLEVE
jgi:hypothetical protein